MRPHGHQQVKAQHRGRQHQGQGDKRQDRRTPTRSGLRQPPGQGGGHTAGQVAIGVAGAVGVGGVGEFGEVGGFGGVAIGAAPVVVAGAMVGSAAYGAKKVLETGDVSAIGAVAGGAVAGAGVSAAIGGMGLAVGGTAVAVGAAPVMAVGAVIGLAAYGISKLLGDR